jgi:hypothetical protein
MALPDYGVDAPGVVRGLTFGGVAALAVAAAGALCRQRLDTTTSNVPSGRVIFCAGPVTSWVCSRRSAS